MSSVQRVAYRSEGSPVVRRALRTAGHNPPLRRRASPGPQHFWDLAARQVESMRHPHLAVAVRTDAPGSEMAV
jgi:hypothetical protein